LGIRIRWYQKMTIQQDWNPLDAHGSFLMRAGGYASAFLRTSIFDFLRFEVLWTHFL
jgi:hypothetical protein